MSAGIDHLIILAASEKRITYDSAALYAFRLDDRDADIDLMTRLTQMAMDGLLVVDDSVNGSFVTVTSAGWAAIA